MDLAKQFVTIGFGPKVVGKMGFQSTEFLQTIIHSISEHMSHSSAGDIVAADGGHRGEGGGH